MRHKVFLSALLVSGAALAFGNEPFLRMPDIHGDKLVFSSEGDLWLGSLSTGQAFRLTSDPGFERNAAFSPDGSEIAFEGEIDGTRQAYVISTQGGPPRRISSIEGFRAVMSWTPNGKEVLVRSFNVPTNYKFSTVRATGGAGNRLPLEFASHVWFGPDTEHYAFTRFNRWGMAWFRYAGGMQNQIWVRRPKANPNDKEFVQITNVPGTNEYPVWLGDRIYFVNESRGTWTLQSVSWKGGKPTVHLTSDVEIRELSTDRTRLVFENGLKVQIFNPATGKTSDVPMKLQSDLRYTMPFTVLASDYPVQTSPSASGKRGLVEARGQIINAPFGEGEARVVLAKAGTRYRHPSMSPDGKKIAAVSDATGEQQIIIADSDGSNEVVLTKGAGRQIWGTMFSPDGKWISSSNSKGELFVVNVETKEERTIANIGNTWFAQPVSWSPDSAWVAYTRNLPISGMGVMELYHLPTGKTHRISDGAGSDVSPQFSTDGKHIAFISRRRTVVTGDPVFNQLNMTPIDTVCITPLDANAADPFALRDPSDVAPAAPESKKTEGVKIDLEGLFARRIQIPFPVGNINNIAMVGNRVLASMDGTLRFFDLSSRQGGVVLQGVGGWTLSPDYQQLIAFTNGPVSLPVMGGEPKPINFSGLRLNIDPKAEWNQIFWDAWRHLRDYFYVENMHGLDWDAIGKKYSAFLPSVRYREELDELIRWMQGEIGSSHQYLSIGDDRDIKPRLVPAYLGVDLAEDPSGFFKITKIYRGDGFLPAERSPLLGQGKNVKEGMFIVSIGGQPVRVGADPFANLIGRAGQTVSVTVNDKPSTVGARTVLVQPVASENRMRYLTWVQANRDYVTKASGGRLGYLHLAAMNNSDMEDFARQYYGQREKEGLIVDARFNNGGWIQSLVNNILQVKLTGYFNQRNNPAGFTRQDGYFRGPMTVLQNEFSISCGEEFTHRFRDIGLGKIIGRRTMGGEVGSSPGWPLIDGGVISVSNYGMYTPDGKWAIEGNGVDPDFDIPSDPNAFVAGRDPQLDKAVSWLFEELKRKPAYKQNAPLSRDRVKGP